MPESPTTSSWSLPSLAPRDLVQVGGGVAAEDAPVLWIDLDVARGLDIAGFLPLPGTARHLRLASAAGRAFVDAVEPDELALLDRLRDGRGPLAADELLGEAGLVRLHRAVCHLRGVSAQRLDAGRIVAKAVAGRCPECARALTIACALLGDLAAQAALALGARGGVYLAGGLVSHLGDWFLRSPFRRRFETRARDRDLLRTLPTFVVRTAAAPFPAISPRTTSLSDARP